MVAKDIQRMGRNTASGNMEYARKQLTGDLVHVWNHQEQTLRCRVGGCQCAGSQRTVYGAGCASLRLHLNNTNRVAEDVLSSGSSPLVYVVRHWAGWCDRVNARHFGKRIRYVCRSGIAIHGFHFSFHKCDVLLFVIGL